MLAMDRRSHPRQALRSNCFLNQTFATENSCQIGNKKRSPVSTFNIMTTATAERIPSPRLLRQRCSLIFSLRSKKTDVFIYVDAQYSHQQSNYANNIHLLVHVPLAGHQALLCCSCRPDVLDRTFACTMPTSTSRI